MFLIGRGVANPPRLASWDVACASVSVVASVWCSMFE